MSSYVLWDITVAWNIVLIMSRRSKLNLLAQALISLVSLCGRNSKKPNRKGREEKQVLPIRLKRPVLTAS